MWRENAVSIAVVGSPDRGQRRGKGAEPRVPPGLSAVPGLRSGFLASTEGHLGNAGCFAWRASVLHRAGLAWRTVFMPVYGELWMKKPKQSSSPWRALLECLPGFVYGKLGMKLFRLRSEKSFIPHRFSCAPGYACFEPAKKTPALDHVN